MTDDEAQPAKPTYNEPITLTLRKPVKFGDRTVTQLTIRPVKAKYMRVLGGPNSALEQTLQMASKLTGEPSQVIDEIEGDDLRELMGHVNGFLFAIQGAGEKS